MKSWCLKPQHAELSACLSCNNVKAVWFVLFLSATLDGIQMQNWARSPSGLFKFFKSLSIHPVLQPITHLLQHSNIPDVSSWGWKTHLLLCVCLQRDSKWSLTNARWERVSTAASLAEVGGHWRKSTPVPCKAGSASSVSVIVSARNAHIQT